MHRWSRPGDPYAMMASPARTAERDRAMREARKKAPAPGDGTEQDQGITFHETLMAPVLPTEPWCRPPR